MRRVTESVTVPLSPDMKRAAENYVEGKRRIHGMYSLAALMREALHEYLSKRSEDYGHEGSGET